MPRSDEQTAVVQRVPSGGVVQATAGGRRGGAVALGAACALVVLVVVEVSAKDQVRHENCTGLRLPESP
ncbi:hypothetical protein ACIQCF_17150 [Streptomyces sp. NPDC088353]|uniref:hypothetical protein n=1 Tax=Streptomyces sp. NPDC088353 TaxID=3365855 RepID=UPI00382F0962